MSQTTAKGERITAIVSTLAAIAILAAGVTAQQQHTAPSQELAQLESNLRFQLDHGFRHDTGARRKRLAKLEQVIAAWQQSARTPSDQRLLGAWMLESTIRSMPGTVEALPDVPLFGVAASPLPPVASAQTVSAQGRFDNSSSPEQQPSALDKSDIPNSEDASHSPQANQAPAGPTHLVATTEPRSGETRLTVQSWEQDFTASASATDSASRSRGEAPVEPARINLTELAARITGYHDRLDEVETKLLTLEETDLDVLAELVGELDEMSGAFRFVQLYYDALTTQERRAITSPRSMQATLAELERQIASSENSLPEDFLSDFESTDHGRQAEQLRRQLLVIADRVGQ